jgi:tetratricopeptide (TPR) repeat protein
VLNRKGFILFSADRYEEAIAVFDTVLKTNPNDTYALSFKGSSYDGLGNFEEAIACFDRVLEVEETDEFAWTSKGSALYSLNRYDEALTCFDRALEIDPQSLEAVQFKELIARKRAGAQ